MVVHSLMRSPVRCVHVLVLLVEPEIDDSLQAEAWIVVQLSLEDRFAAMVMVKVRCMYKAQREREFEYARPSESGIMAHIQVEIEKHYNQVVHRSLR